jgi:hypothetical protein
MTTLGKNRRCQFPFFQEKVWTRQERRQHAGRKRRAAGRLRKGKSFSLFFLFLKEKKKKWKRKYARSPGAASARCRGRGWGVEKGEKRQQYKVEDSFSPEF